MNPAIDRRRCFHRFDGGTAVCLAIATAVLAGPAMANLSTTVSTAAPLPSSGSAAFADTPIGARECRSGEVVVSAGDTSSASTHRAVRLNFSLAPGLDPCSLTGYPGVDSGTGGPLIHAERTPRGFMGGLPNGVDEPPTVILWPSAHASAVLEGRAVDTQGNQCPTYTDVGVTPPNTTQTVTVAVSIDSCELQIHPLTGD